MRTHGRTRKCVQDNCKKSHGDTSHGCCPDPSRQAGKTGFTVKTHTQRMAPRTVPIAARVVVFPSHSICLEPNWASGIRLGVVIVWCACVSWECIGREDAFVCACMYVCMYVCVCVCVCVCVACVACVCWWSFVVENSIYISTRENQPSTING